MLLRRLRDRDAAAPTAVAPTGTDPANRPPSDRPVPPSAGPIRPEQAAAVGPPRLPSGSTPEPAPGPVQAWSAAPEPAFRLGADAPGGHWGRLEVDQPVVPDDHLLPRPRARMGPRLGVVVIACALVTVGLALAHLGPFSSSPGLASTPSVTTSAPVEVRGTWSALIGFGTSLSAEALQIDTENRSTGQFTAAVLSPVGVETMTGTVSGSTMTFNITLGTSTDSGTATISTTNGKLEIQGTFSNASGARGKIFATRTST